MTQQAKGFDRPISLSELVRRAVGIVDPDDEDGVVGDFELRFEDADEPVTGIENLEERIGFGADEDPAIVVAQAVVLHLAHRRDELDQDDDDVLEHAVKSQFGENPPQSVIDWLQERGAFA